VSEKWVSKRFASPTQDFDLDILVSRLRRGFLLSVGLAVVVHLALATLIPSKRARKKRLDHCLPSSSNANRG
jgi:hypothetical protein